MQSLQSTKRYWPAFAFATVLAGTARLHAAANDFTLDGALFNNISYTQTSNSAPTSSSGSFFNISAASTSGGSYSSATVAYPGPASPQPLDPDGFGNFSYGSSVYSSQTALHADYPFGTYAIAASGASGTARPTLNYTADHFTTTTPYISNFSSLSGANPATPITVTFPGFTPDAAATSTFTFFTIDNNAGTVVYSAGFLSPTTTSVTIAANTLSANTPYTFELDYSDRIDGQDNTNNQFTELGFDQRDDGAFTTGATPEPLVAAQAMLGLSGLMFFGRRARGSRLG